jgi:hypothetical protein
MIFFIWICQLFSCRVYDHVTCAITYRSQASCYYQFQVYANAVDECQSRYTGFTVMKRAMVVKYSQQCCKMNNRGLS